MDGIAHDPSSGLKGLVAKNLVRPVRMITAAVEVLSLRAGLGEEKRSSSGTEVSDRGRIEKLERKNAELRSEIDRLRGKALSAFCSPATA